MTITTDPTPAQKPTVPPIITNFQHFLYAVENIESLAGVEGAKRIADLLKDNSVKRWLSTTRARMLADEHYMNGISQRSLAEKLGVTVNAVSLWLQEYGPQQYVSVREEQTDDGTNYVIELIKPRSVAQMIGAGRRVAPATLGLYDNEVGLALADSPEGLWRALASQD